MKKTPIFLFVLLLFIALPVEAKRWKRSDVVALINQVNQAWQSSHPAETNAFWDNAAYHTANMEVYKLTGDGDQLAYSLRWAEHNKWMGATEPDPAKWRYKNYGEGMAHVLFGDWQICFQTYIDLYNIYRRSSDVCSSDLGDGLRGPLAGQRLLVVGRRPLYGDARNDEDVPPHQRRHLP